MAITIYSLLFYLLSTLVHHVSLFINFSHVRVSFSNHISVSIPIPDHFPQRHLLSPQVLPTSVSLLSPLFPYPVSLRLPLPLRFLRLFQPPFFPDQPCAVDVNKHLDYTVKAASTPNPDWKLDFTFPRSRPRKLLSLSFSLFPSFPVPSTFLNTVLVRIPSSLVYPSPSITRNLSSSTCLSRFVFSVLHLSSIFIRYIPSICLPVCLSACRASTLALFISILASLPYFSRLPTFCFRVPLS